MTDQPSVTIGAPVAMQLKHEHLDRAIQRIDELSIALRSFHLKVTGDPSAAEAPDPAQPQPPRLIPSLCEVLNEGPDRIHKQIDVVQGLIDDLREALF